MSGVTRATPRRKPCTDMLVTFIICNQRSILCGFCIYGGLNVSVWGGEIIGFVIDAKVRV